MNAQTGSRVVGREEALSSRALAAALAGDGRALLPLLDLITTGKAVVDEAIDVMGRATIEAVLELSAREVAGEPHQGRKGRGITRHGRQRGAVPLSDRTLRVARPRLRGKDGEVAVPAYEALKEHPGAGARMMDTLLKGVSTRNSKGVIREMADTAGVSKSAAPPGYDMLWILNEYAANQFAPCHLAAYVRVG